MASCQCASDEEWVLIRDRLIGLLYERDGYMPVNEKIKQELAARNQRNVEDARAALLENGKFSDIDYGKVGYQHTQRIFSMALEYARVGGPLLNDPALLSDIHSALHNWFSGNHDPGPRWTDVEFRVPKYLYWTALLLGDDLPSEYVPEIGKYTENDPENRVGMNRIWLCVYQSYWAAYTRDAGMMSRLSALMQAELAFKSPGEEGLQADFSWLQHGPQLYMGGYGMPVIIEIGQFASVLANTRFAFPDTSVKVLSAYVLRGQRWILWRNRIDYSTRGRAIVRIDKPGENPPDMRSSYFWVMLEIMMDIDPANRIHYEQMRKEMDSQRGEISSLVGTRYFPRADYMVHRNGKWSATVRMVSTRTHSTEQGHSEGLKNYFLADGGNFLYMSGHEYLNIFPVWDWRKVPGVTCEDSDAAIPYIPFADKDLRRGGSSFAGGVSDGRNGACAMVLEKDGVTARKSWFFLDNGYICLGAGIRGREGVKLSTSVNQCLANGEAFLIREGKQVSIAGSVQVDSPCVIYHDNVAYAFPENQQLQVHHGDQSGYRESIEWDRRDGDWRTLDYSKFKKITMPVFAISLSHQPDAFPGQYAYFVEPGIAQPEATLLRSDPMAEIMVNTPSLQAVRQVHDGLIQAVFYEAGSLPIDGVGTIAVSTPCILMCRSSGATLEVCLADPNQSSAAVVISLNGNPQDIELPKGPHAGETVHFTVDLN